MTEAIHPTPTDGGRFLDRPLDHAPIGVVTVDGAGLVLGCNTCAGELLGRAEAELVGLALADLFLPDVGSKLDRFLDAAAAGRAGPESFERAKGSDRQTLELSAAPLTDEGRAGCLVLLQDVTRRVLAEREQARAQEELRLRKALLESQVESSLEGVLVVGAEGRMVSFNRRFVEMWGIPPDVVESRSDDAALRFVHEQVVDPDAFFARVQYLYEQPEEESEEEIDLVDGRTFDRYSAPIREADGTIHGRVWYFRDITARKRHEEELRHRLEQLRSIYGVAAVVARAESLEEILDDALDRLVAAAGAQRGSILLLDEEGMMRFRVWRGLSDSYRTAVEGHSPWPPGAEDPQPKVVADVESDAGLAPLREVIAAEGIRSLAFVPLVHRGRLIGKFMLYWDEPHELAPEDLRLAQAIASHVASAAERRRTERELQESRDQLQIIFQGVGDGITVQDATGRVVFANEAAARLIGYRSTEEVVDTPPEHTLARFELIDESGQPLPPDRLPGRRALDGEEAEVVIGWRLRATGEERWSVVTSRPVFGESGAVEFAINIFHDVTERRRAEESVRFLAEASEVLAESLDYANTLRRVAELAVPRIADWCIVYMVQPDGSIERLAVHHAGGLHENVLGRLSSYPFDPESRTGVPAVLRTGRPLLVADADDTILAADLVGGARLAEELASLGIKSWMCVPLSARGRTLGAISLLAAESGRRFGDRELELAEELAGRAALAVDNARLYEETQALLEAERRARADAEAAAETLRRLQHVTEASLSHIAMEDLVGEMLERIRELLGVDTAAVLLLDEQEGELVARVAKGLEEEVERGVRVPVGAGFAGKVASERRAIVIEDTEGADLANPLLRERGLKSLLGVPLAIEGRVIGVLHVGTLTPRAFTADDAVLLQLVGDRVAGALDLSDLYEKEKAARAEAEAAQERLEFLAEASSALSESLDYEETLTTVAELAVPRVADWCVVDILEEDGSLRRLAIAHADPDKLALAHDFARRYPPRADASAVAKVIETGEPALVSEISDELLGALTRDEEQRRMVGELGLRSYLSVPMRAPGRTLGAITFVTAESGRVYGDADLALAAELARRAALAVENARLYREAEQRGHAAQALTFVGDGVFIVDHDGYVRLWNPAAEAITALPETTVVGRPVREAIPGWTTLEGRVPIVPSDQPATVRPEAVPVELHDRELWLSISGVAFAEGTVFAFRDITEERGLDKMKSDFVSTVSHELRTPLAAIYGAALTLQRGDLPLQPDQRSDLLTVIASEAERLARIVNDILWASRLEAENVQITIESCDAAEIAATVLQAARLHVPDTVELALEAPAGLPPLAADPDKVRQVLSNLIDNAVKYSPDGGRVDVRLHGEHGALTFVVTDSGLGIPPAEQERIFEKFYRLDPDLTRGVGGTGLGLYICRELVRRMDGRIWVDSRVGDGSVFHVELPLAEWTHTEVPGQT